MFLLLSSTKSTEEPGVVGGGCWSETADMSGWEDSGVEGYSVCSQAHEEGRWQALAGSFLDHLWLTLLWNSHVLGFCSRATQASPLEQSRPSWGCSQLGEKSGSEPTVTGQPRAPALPSCSQTSRLWVQQTPGPQLLPWEQRATTLGPQTSHRKALDFCREMLAGSFIN